MSMTMTLTADLSLKMRQKIDRGMHAMYKCCVGKNCFCACICVCTVRLHDMCKLAFSTMLETTSFTARPFVVHLSSQAHQTLDLRGWWARLALLAAASSKCKRCHDQDPSLSSQVQLHPQCMTHCHECTCGTTASTLTVTQVVQLSMRQQLDKMW